MEKLESASGRDCEITAYFPINFSDEDYANLADLVQNATIIFDQLYKYRFIGGYRRDDFIDLSFNHCTKIVSKFNETKKLLLDAKILERTEYLTAEINDISGSFAQKIEIPRGFLSPNKFAKTRSFGYRFVDPDYRKNFHKVEITNPAVVRQVKKYNSNSDKPVLRWLQANNEKLEIIEPVYEDILNIAGGDKDLSENYMDRLYAIKDQHWIFEIDDFSGRVHNNITILKSETRKYLRINGHPLCEIDIPCSQWLFLAIICVEKGFEDSQRFLRICEDDLYSYIAGKANTTREDVKEILTQQCLFSRNDAACQKNPIKLIFDQEFPLIASFINQNKDGTITKANPKPWNQLAKILQEKERKFVINTVCQRIFKEKKELFIGTVHDSLLVESHHAEYVKNIMQDEFQKLGAKPKMTIKNIR